MVRRRRAIRAAIAVAAWTAMVSPAVAAPTGVVVIATTSAPATADDTARAMARGLGAAEAGAAIDALAAARAGRSQGAVPAERLRGFARAAALAAEGWRAYLAVDGEFAAARLAAARAEAEELLALDGGGELYADVSLRLGLVLAALGRTAEAGDVLRLAHALDPDRAPSASEFSPDAVAAYQAAIAAAPARRALEVEAPAGATVELDGHDVGRASSPFEVTVGQHVVVARAPGRVARGQAVSVAAAKAGEGPAVVELVLDDDPGAALDDPQALAVGAAAGRAGPVVAQVLLHAEVDAVLLVASVRHGGEPALVGQRCVDARPACTDVVEVDYADGGLDGAARLLLDRLAAARLRDGVSLPSDGRLRGGRGPRPGGDRRRRWLYTGLGVAAVAAVVTTLVLVGGDDGQPVITIDPGDFGL